MAKATQEDKSVHAAIPNFSKTFDKVPHQRLLRKYYGICGVLFIWFDHSFINSGFQSEVYDGLTMAVILSPLPQGFEGPTKYGLGALIIPA